jgi:hypothetical protein
MAPTVKEVYDGRAGFLWNVLCCPLVCTVGLFYRSLTIFCAPCLNVLFFRCFNPVQRVAARLCYCCCAWPYEDDDFFGAAALGDHSANDPNKMTAKQMAKETDWVRAKDLDEFEGKRPQLFEGKIEPSDLCQGAVGDCWLVAAFACASEFPDSIRSLFVTKEYNPRGLYKVRIFDPVIKKWKIITVDDRIPCQKGTKKPRFMNPNGNELWAIILEKAYAKLCGGYANLDGGFVLWGWHSMTGDNVFQMSRKEDGTWYREDMVAMDNPKNKRACGFRKTNEVYTEENLWTLLKKYDKQKALLSASIGKMDYSKVKGKKSGPSGEQMLEDEGLVAGHAYSVIQAKEVTESKKVSLAGMNVALDMGMSGKAKVRLVQLRNPWGTFEWKGDWSDKSPLWKQHPHIQKEVKFEDLDDGAFWMTFEDFSKYYTRVNVCDRTTSSDLSLDVNEDRGSCGIVGGWLCGCANFWLCCKGARNLYCGHESTEETLDAREKTCWCV